MKYFFLSLYLILVITGGISNYFVSGEDKAIQEFALIVSLYYGSIVFYFISIIGDNKTLIMLVPKYFQCFSVTYKKFVLNSYIELILKRVEIIPLIISPPILFLSDLSFSQATIAFLSLFTILIYSLFILLLLFHWSTLKKVKSNFNNLLVLSFIVPFYFAYKFESVWFIVLNPLGTFLSSALFMSYHANVMILSVLQAFIVFLLLVAGFKKGLREWPIY